MLEIEKLKLEHEEKITTFEQQEYGIKEMEENMHSIEVLLEEKRVELNSLKDESFRVKEKLMDAQKMFFTKLDEFQQRYDYLTKLSNQI